MYEDPLEAVYAFVERAYVRMQAAEVLTQCLDEGRLSPLQDLVEALVLAGPDSLDILREILLEVDARKSQIRQDQHQVFARLESNLEQYGVRLGKAHSPASLMRLTPAALLALLRSQQVVDEEDQVACLGHFREALEVMSALMAHLYLLNEIEAYLMDWLWGLVYQSVHQGWENEKYLASKNRWLL
jgi:hypothetical protein